MDAKVEYLTDADLGGAPEGLDALIVAERIKAGGGVGLFVARDFQRSGSFVQAGPKPLDKSKKPTGGTSRKLEELT